MIGAYSSTLVALSILVAMMASYTALDLAGRVTNTSGRTAALWLVGGAFSMGAGIWSMHFIGMLAFSLPIRMSYDLTITLISMLFAVGVSGIALALASRPRMTAVHIVVGGVLMGLGICGMHYTGMEAMRMSPAIQYDPLLFAASVVIAMGASMVALWLAFTLRAFEGLRAVTARTLAAMVMGLAISGMHYTGMAAANFAPGSFCLVTGPGALGGPTLAFAIGAAIISILTVTLAGSILDAHLARKTTRFLESLKATNRELKAEVAAREQSQRSLQDSEERFRLAFENAPIGMSMVSIEGRWLKANRALCEMIGYTEAELRERDFQSITHPDDLAADLAQIQELLADRIKSYQIEKRYFHKDGHIVWIMLSVSLVRSAAGKPPYFVDQIKDITEAKALTEALRARSEELERSNRELEQFAYVASHDLQAPLRSITGFVQLLGRRLEKSLDNDSRDFMKFIVESTKQMQRLIESLLDIGQVGKQGLQTEPTGMNAVMQKAREHLAELIAERGVVIESQPLPTVSGDPVLLSQLMQNLLSNAIKFQPQEHPMVSVSSKREGSEWVFGVQDHGIGIEPQHTKRIFQMFQRLHTPDKYEGSGIGLTICEKIVRLHGGRIWVDSIPGQGSTFYFTIPDRAPDATT